MQPTGPGESSVCRRAAKWKNDPGPPDEMNQALADFTLFPNVPARWLKNAILALFVLAALAWSGCSTRQIPPWLIQDSPSLPVRYALARVAPAVVRIDVVMRNYVDGRPAPFRAIGSGVIIDRQGHVLTNFHVAGRARRIEITLADQRRVSATRIGSDHWTDLALLQLNLAEIQRKHLHFAFAPLGNSRHVALGQTVLAIGTPYGLSRTVTRGIISNTDRYFRSTTIDGYETGWFNNWLQTDAAINPGNSGGPLVNLRGEVIGINTRGDPEANNLGFAIPINVAKRIIPGLLARGRINRSYIGVRLAPIHDLGGPFKRLARRGVLIASVDPQSPASMAGLQPQDVLLSVNGHPTNCRFPEQLAAIRRLIADQPVGSVLTLRLDRANQAGKLQSLTLRLPTQLLQSAVTPQHMISAWGIAVRNLTAAYLRQQRLAPRHGVLVTGVRGNSPADTAGMQAGDIIVSVNGQTVDGSRFLRKLAWRLKKAKHAAAVVVQRDRGEITLVLSPSGG